MIGELTGKFVGKFIIRDLKGGTHSGGNGILKTAKGGKGDPPGIRRQGPNVSIRGAGSARTSSPAFN